MGILYGIGVGPGDSELITLKALNIIKNADIIAIPAASKEKCTAYNIVKEVLDELDEKEIISCKVTMTSDVSILNNDYANICRAIGKILDEGKNIAFLNLGDPTLYGTYMQVHTRILDMGYEAKIVNGVPSICAVAGTLGIPLGTRDECIHIIPGFYESSKDVNEYESICDSEIGRLVLEYLDKKDSVVIMKTAGNFNIIKLLMDYIEENKLGRGMAVINCGMPDEKIIYDFKEIDEAGYFTTIIIKPL